MAVWQFDLYFAPYDSTLPDTSTPGWEPVLPNKTVYALQEDMAHYFGPPWFMLGDWIVFGPENGNRVDLLFEEKSEASIGIRIDTRNEAPQFLVLITDLARLHNCKLFSASLAEFIEPDSHHVLNAISRWEVRKMSQR